jgi:hypothetical protein
VDLHALPPDLQQLTSSLQRHGFEVRLAPPPQRGVYGLYEAKPRRIWVSPLAFELGIGRQVFIHEATHAVQSCGGAGMRPLGVTGELNPVVEHEISGILFNSYHSGNRLIEREAFTLQGQPGAVTFLINTMRSRCRM